MQYDAVVTIKIVLHFKENQLCHVVVLFNTTFIKL